MSPNPLEIVERGQSRSNHASPIGINTPRPSAAMPNINKIMGNSIRPSGRKEQ
jgi:hypothetical protein